MSKIEWTDKTWNPIVGCSQTSPGCAHCYAERMACRLAGMGKEQYIEVIDPDAAAWDGNTVFVESQLEKPLHWRKPQVIFVCSMGDLFHESVPWEWIDRVFAVMALCPQHVFILLTKRAERMEEYVCDTSIVRNDSRGEELYKINPNALTDGIQWPLPNVIGMVTVENQDQTSRIRHLLETPLACRGISIEPMLGDIDICKYVNLRMKCVNSVMVKKSGCGYVGPTYEFDGIKSGSYSCPRCKKNHSFFVTDSLDWVICGGESGPGARPMHPDWARKVRDDCDAAGVPFFFKQWGGVNKKTAGRLLDGVEHNGLPPMVERILKL